MAKKHCKTCRCYKKMSRHTCIDCKTKKLAKFLVNFDGPKKGWGSGGGHWRCLDKSRCLPNQNYA